MGDEVQLRRGRGFRAITVPGSWVRFHIEVSVFSFVSSFFFYLCLLSRFCSLVYTIWCFCKCSDPTVYIPWKGLDSTMSKDDNVLSTWTCLMSIGFPVLLIVWGWILLFKLLNGWVSFDSMIFSIGWVSIRLYIPVEGVGSQLYLPVDWS